MVRRDRASFIREGKLTQTKYHRNMNSAQSARSAARRQKLKLKESWRFRALPPALTSQDLKRKETPSAEEKIQLKEKNTSHLKFSGV